MSRANPIALRITSKTQSSMYIGVSKSYFYDHLKQNINIGKLTERLSKQIALPTNKLVKYNVANSDQFTVLTPHLLPINTACLAKQLFSTKYCLNKRRFCSAVLHYVRWLQDNFNKKYKRFNTSNASFKYKHEKPYRLRNLAVAAVSITDHRSKHAKKNYTQFCHITKANQIGGIYRYFLLNRFNDNICKARPLLLQRQKSNVNFVNSLMDVSNLTLKSSTGPFAFAKAKGNKKAGVGAQAKRIQLFDSKLLNMQNFKAGHNFVKPNNFSLLGNPAAVKANVLQKVEQLSCFRPNYEHMSYSMFLLASLSLLYWENRHINQVPAPISGISLTNQPGIVPQKALLSTEKAPRSNSTNPGGAGLFTKYCYVISPYSGLKKSNDSNFSKVQKHINLFRNTAKPVIPIELVISRSFCEPASLNYISALENRLSKSHFNINFSNALFRRASQTGFIANYTNTQTGLIRLKAQVIFEFLYTGSDRGESGVKQDDHSNQYMFNVRNQRPWLRKRSSVRL